VTAQTQPRPLPRLARGRFCSLGKAKTLAEKRKGHENKLQIALRLRQETTMTFAWIAGR
jgi:hypothetical protein